MNFGVVLIIFGIFFLCAPHQFMGIIIWCWKKLGRIFPFLKKVFDSYIDLFEKDKKLVVGVIRFCGIFVLLLGIIEFKYPGLFGILFAL